jgi:hypothetical protein
MVALMIALVWLVVPPTGQEETIPWSPSRKLTWQDYKASAPNRLDGARTALNYQSAVGCRNGRLEATVRAVFLPQQSWVAERIRSSALGTRVGLQHEQVHFDLAEVYARRARKMLAELKNPCPRSDEDLGALVDRVLRDLYAAQQRYENETRAGENETRQLEWVTDVARDLAALAAFAEKPGSTATKAREVGCDHVFSYRLRMAAAAGRGSGCGGGP